MGSDKFRICITELSNVKASILHICLCGRGRKYSTYLQDVPVGPDMCLDMPKVIQS